MFAIWTYANSYFEPMAPLHLQHIVLSIFAFMISLMVIVEGIYKAGPLIFNCKDDQLLLSLPIKRRTVLFVRIFKFYVFELMFTALFIIPLSVAYIRWAESLEWTFFLTSILMIFLLPIIPVVISCIIGAITAGLSGRFKYKNAAQIIVSMVFLVGVLYLSMNIDKVIQYLVTNATSINEVITKLYYPAGVYSNLVTNFSIKELLLFILVNIAIFTIALLMLSKFYFKINSRLKKVTTHKSSKKGAIKYNSSGVITSLTKKELNTFFKTPVFIINAGFGVILHILIAIVLCFKAESLLNAFDNGKVILDNMSVLIFAIMLVASLTTSITSSMISLEGRNINILKSLPVSTKKILIAKIVASSILTIPAFIIGDIILFVRFAPSIIEMLLIIILTILTPLIPHFLGLIVNLKYPKLEFETEAEVVKQSTSSFISVTFGFMIAMFSALFLFNIIGTIDSLLILLIFTGAFIVIDIILYLLLTTKGVKDFNKLSV
jgi:ABC-2 type transport system permease protein